MILAFILVSLYLILRHFPVFNVVKSSVSGLFRPQGHVWIRGGIWCKKEHRVVKQGIFDLCWSYCRYGDREVLFKASIATVSPRGRHGDKKINSRSKPIRCSCHGDIKGQMATSLKIFIVAIFTTAKKMRMAAIIESVRSHLFISLFCRQTVFWGFDLRVA